MGEKRIYKLKNQRLIHGRDNVSKMCCCIFLVVLVICGLIALTGFFVNNAKKGWQKNQGYLDQTNYVDVGAANKDMLEINKQHDARSDHTFTTLEGSNTEIGSSQVKNEFTATSVESPLSPASTMSPNQVSPRFLFVNTYDTASSDNIDTRSTNDYVRLTTKSGHNVNDITKRTTESNLFNDAPITPKDESVDILSEWISSIYNGETTYDGLVDDNSTPKAEYESQSDKCLKVSDEEKCLTISCKQSASRMLALMNHAIDPCKDFYSYACGGFDTNHFKEFTPNDEILESMPDISTMDLEVPYKKVYHDFFISCSNYKNGNGLKEVSKFLYDLCQNHKDDLTDLIADILMLHPQKSPSRLLPLFDVIMEVGEKKTMVPTLSLPKFNSPLAEDNEMDMYDRACLNLVKLNADNKNNKLFIQQSYKECLQNQTEYFKNLEKSIFLLQIFEHLSEFRKVQMIKKTLQFIEWNILSEFGSISQEELNDDKIETVGLNWLIEVYPQIDWIKLFKKLFGEENAKHITEVRMRHSSYLVKIFNFYRVNTFEEIKTSLLSMMAHDMYIDFIEPQLACDRYKYCQNIAMALMPDIASKLYLEQFDTAEIVMAQIQIKTIFKQLVQTYNTSISANTWLSLDEKMKNLKKISELNLMVDPYLTIFSFEKNYHKLYAEVSISPNDYISNVFTLKQVTRKRMYDSHGKSAESSDIIWNHLVWPISTVPTRIVETDTIVFPTSVIRKFSKRGQNELQKFQVFATIGFLMAHQMAKIFEDTKTPNIFINENEVFPTTVEIHLDDPAYSKTPNIFGIKLDEKDISASKNSRFADDLSLRMTMDTYSAYITSEKSFPWTNDSISKLFYTLVSQQFCTARKSVTEMAVNLIQNENLPSYFRVNSMMMNSENFLNTFECQYGTK